MDGVRMHFVEHRQAFTERTHGNNSRAERRAKAEKVLTGVVWGQDDFKRSGD